MQVASILNKILTYHWNKSVFSSFKKNMFIKYKYRISSKGFEWPIFVGSWKNAHFCPWDLVKYEHHYFSYHLLRISVNNYQHQCTIKSACKVGIIPLFFQKSVFRIKISWIPWTCYLEGNFSRYVCNCIKMLMPDF